VLGVDFPAFGLCFFPRFLGLGFFPSCLCLLLVRGRVRYLSLCSTCCDRDLMARVRVADRASL